MSIEQKKISKFVIHKWLLKCVMVFVSNPLLVIYTFGDIMQHVNGELEIPVLKLNSLANQCVGIHKEHPSAEQLLTLIYLKNNLHAYEHYVP